MASAPTAYVEHMANFDAEQRSKARSTAFLTNNLAKYLPTPAPPAIAVADFTDEHSYDDAQRASDRAAQQAEWQSDPSWRKQ